MAAPGDRVSFRAGDVFLPGPSEALAALTKDSELLGTLIELSDSGEQPGIFAVVGLPGDGRVIVRADKLCVLVASQPH